MLKPNFQGDHTLLLLERLSNPGIKRRLIDNLHEDQATRSYPERIFRPDKDGNLVEVPLHEWRPMIKSRAEVASELEGRIKNVFSVTDIGHEDKGANFGSVKSEGDPGTIWLFSINPETREKYTTRQLNMAEAHEKGHGIRLYEKRSDFAEKLLSGFDFSKIKFSPSEIDFLRSTMEDDDLSNEDIKDGTMSYHTQPSEIIERMAQLKNYFGMRGVEEFTKEHLDYSRKHYISDVGFPELQIKPFFEAITPKTEKMFLELMNTLGI
jgi:hypothetical protein